MGGHADYSPDYEVAGMSYETTTEALFDTAGDAIMLASLSAGRISSAPRPTLKETGFSYTVGDSDLDEPPRFSDMFDGVGDPNDDILLINDQVDAWLAKYFPAINSGFQGVPEDWLIGVISGVKPFGIESTIFDLVWHKARDRAYQTTETEQRTLRATFSERGFTLPPAALVDALAQSEQRATNAILDVSRDQAIKDADIKNDLLKHAVTVAAQLKQGILNTSADFFRAYHRVYDSELERIRARTQAYAAYYNALASYYNVETSWEQLRLRAAETGANVDNAIDRNRISVFSEDGAASAHAQASRGFADIAAASANAAGTLNAEVYTAAAGA